MAGLNVDSLRRKFQALNNTQDSIQTLSLWIIHHKNHYRHIVELWMEHLREAKPPMRLTLFYLANDILQNSKRKGATVFLDSFAEVLEEAATFSREEGIREKVLRIFKIWGERSIYTVELCDKLQKATVSQKPAKPKPRPDPKLLADFNHDDVPEVIEQLARFEGEVELKCRQLGMLNVDVASTETIMQLKDRAGGKRFSQQFEDSAIKLEDYVTSLTKEVELRRRLFDLLQKSEIFYEAQFGEAKIVANAYKNFGMRVASLKKRLEEHKSLLPDSFSPIPSPTMDAPSPGATPPRDPNSDSIEVEDMELSEEEEDRRRGSIIAAPSMATRRASRLAALRNKTAVTTSSSTSGISHISTITGAGSHSAFNQPLPSYSSPFSNRSPSADYSPSEDFTPIPTSGAAQSLTRNKEGGEENYGPIKDRLLQVMHDAPKLPSSVNLFDSPQRMGSKRSSKLPPVSIPSYTPSPKAYDQQVSPIIAVPPAVPAPVPPQALAVPPLPDEYDPFENEYSTEAPGYYTHIDTVVAAPGPPSQQPPSPPDDDDDDVYDPEMVDYLLEMPLAQKNKPQSSCIIPLAGGFRSPTSADVQKTSDQITSGVYGKHKPANVPSKKETSSPQSVKSKKSTNSNKPGGTPLRDECSTPPTQEESPMLKEATSNPIEFLTKIITSSRQSAGNKAPSSSFLSSLSLLTQTVQSAAQKEKSEQISRDTKPGDSTDVVISPKFLKPPDDSDSDGTDLQQLAMNQNHASSRTAVPFSIGSLVSSFKEEPNPTAAPSSTPGSKYTVSGAAEGQMKTIPSESHDTPQVTSTASSIKQNHASSRTTIPFSIGALVSSFKEDSNPTPAPVSTSSPVSKGSAFGAAVYHKPNKVPLCQIMNTPAPVTTAVLTTSIHATVPVEPADTPPDSNALSTLGDNTEASLASSLMARLMHNKTKVRPGFKPSSFPSSISPGPQPPNLMSIILEPPPPPPLPPDESMGSSACIVPTPPPEEQCVESHRPIPPAGPPPPVHQPPPPSGPPPPPSGPPPSGPPLPPPPSGPPPPPSGPPPSGPPLPPRSPPQPLSNLPPTTPPLPPNGLPQSSPPPSGPAPPPNGPPPTLTDSLPQPHGDQPLSPSGPSHSGPTSPPVAPPTTTGPLPSLSPSIRNAAPRMLVRVPPPPPGPPPPNAKRAGGAPNQASAGQAMPGPHGLPPNDKKTPPPTSPLEQTSDAPPSVPSETRHSPPVSPVRSVTKEPAGTSQPSSPIPVLGTSPGTRERSIPFVHQAKSAKDMWEQPPFRPRSPGIPSKYNELPKRPIEKFDYSHTRPIETLERKRVLPQERFHEDHPQRNVFRSSEQLYDTGMDRYAPPFPQRESGRRGGYDNIGRGRGYSNPDGGYDREQSLGLDFSRGRGQDLDRIRGQEPGRGSRYDPSEFRSTQQLIEKELNALAGDLQPRGVPISTLGGRPDRGRHARDYNPLRREDPQHWGGPPNKRQGPPAWGQRPPNYRY